MFLGDEVCSSELSSKHQPFGNNDRLIKRLVSRENLLVAHFDRREDMRGFHTQNEENPWIMLELKGKHRISGLIIDAFGYHNRNMCVWVSNDGKNETLVCKADETRRRYRIDLQNKNVSAKFIRIGRAPGTPKDWFYLDKIVIYGK